MKLIYLYDEFMRVPDGEEGQPVYIIDGELNEGYEISQKVHEYRYFLAKKAGAKIFQGNTLELFNKIHQETNFAPKEPSQPSHITSQPDLEQGRCSYRSLSKIPVSLPAITLSD